MCGLPALCNIQKTVLCFFVFQKMLVALEAFRKRAGSPDSTYQVVGSDAVFSQQKSCVSASPTG